MFDGVPRFDELLKAKFLASVLPCVGGVLWNKMGEFTGIVPVVDTQGGFQG